MRLEKYSFCLAFLTCLCLWISFAQAAERETPPAWEETAQGETGEDRQTEREETEEKVREETGDLLGELGMSDIDRYLTEENLSDVSFSELVKQLMADGMKLDFKAAGEALLQALFDDYAQNRKTLLQILTLAVAFSVLLQITSAMERGYLVQLSFLSVYLTVMLLLMKLFLIMTDIMEGFFAKLVDFMQMLQPVFCISMVFSTGSVSAGAYYELLLLLIYIVDVTFTKALLPAVRIYMVLQLVNHMMEEQLFSRAAELVSDGVKGCVKLLATAVVGLNIVQGLLAPGIDGVRRSTLAGAVRAVPGMGQVVNSMTEILAGSAMLIKNSVGAAALLLLVSVSFLPAIKIAVFMVSYRLCAALIEPVTDKRISGAVASLGHAAGLYLKLMFYAVLLFFITIAVICAATTMH